MGELIMLQTITTAFLWFSAIGCGLMAGVYFAFSAFIMRALETIEKSAAISAMQAVNDVILRSLFMPLFMGTTVAAAVLAIIAIVRWNSAGSGLILAGGVIYVAGMFVVTMVLNVPLNNALVAVSPDGAEASAVWSRYLTDWTFWNHVRTISSTIASALFILAIAVK
jgi:uncharacterized membrane protein